MGSPDEAPVSSRERRLAEALTKLWQLANCQNPASECSACAAINRGEWLDKALCEARAALASPEADPATVLREVLDERLRQDARWGEQNHDPLGWLAILAEEFGEVAAEVTKACVPPVGDRDAHLAKLRGELIQTAAVAVAFVECLDRAALGLPVREPKP